MEGLDRGGDTVPGGWGGGGEGEVGDDRGLGGGIGRSCLGVGWV